MSNDERVLALFQQTPRISFDDIISKAGMQRLDMLQTLTRLVDRGVLRRNRVRTRGSSTTYFELRQK